LPAFEVAWGSGHGLSPQAGEVDDADLLYWEPSPLLDTIRQKLQALETARNVPAGEASMRREQAEVLRHLLHFWSVDDITKRDRRHSAPNEAMPVVVGFTPICNALEYAAYSQRMPAPGQDQEQPYQYTVVGLSGLYLAGDVRDGMVVYNPKVPKAEPVTTWHLLDQSESGYRLGAPVREGATLPVGTLIVLVPTADDWVIGVIRRIKKVSSAQAEYGVERMGSHAHLVALRVPSAEWFALPEGSRRDS